jgi:C1A family cysteine protease
LKLTFPRKATFVAAVIICTLLLSSAMAAATTLDDIGAAIRQRGARWTARETKVSKLPPEKKFILAGALPPRVTGNELLVSAAASPAGAPLAAAAASLDWRNHNGNFVTPVRDQGGCGSCWAFAATAGLESYTLIKNNTPGQNLNLSEQVMLSCSGGGDCDGGYIDDASIFAVTAGLPLETCYAYTETKGNCSNACANWRKSSYSIGSWAYVCNGTANVTNIKNALANYGPVVAFMWVYNDFMYYGSGVYSHTTGSNLGGHAILIVGYDDANQCFIVKNSWGPGWGESGYFRIAYTECNNGVGFGCYSIAYLSDLALNVSTNSLTASCLAGRNAASQSFQVWNSKNWPLPYTISTNAGWLSVKPASGSSSSERDSITVNFATASLARGTYQGVITVNAGGVNTQQITVDLQVAAAPEVIAVNPATLITSCTERQNAPSQSFEVWNSGTGTLKYSITGNSPWLTVNPAGGASTGAPDTIAVNYASANLAAGSYQGLITVAAPGADPRQVTVNLQVIPLPPAISPNPGFLYNVCKPGKNAVSQTFDLSNSGGGTLSYRVATNQPWLSVTPASGAATATSPNTLRVNYATAGLTPGKYTAVITVTAAGATNTPQSIPVTLRVSRTAGQLPWLEMLLDKN